MSGISRDDWLNALGGAETCDPDAMTRAELGALLGIGASATKERVRRLIANGGLIVTRKRVTNAIGRVQVIPAYLLVKPKKRR